MNKSFLHVPLYPFLIALAPVFSFYGANRLELYAFDVIRPAVVCSIVALFAVTVSRAVFPSLRGAAVLGCVLLLSVFAYGYAYQSTYLVSGLEIRNRYFLPVWLALTVGAYFLLARSLRRTSSPLHKITKILNVFGIALIAATLAPLMFANPLSHLEGGAGDRDELGKPRADDWLPAQAGHWNGRQPPDVYYIILDAYARGDVLKSQFDLDNSDFLDWLGSKGFFVGHLSHSNYPWTHLSLSATLNGEYLQTLLPEELKSLGPDEYRSRYQFFTGVLARDYIQTSRVHRFFLELGYRIISNDSGYAVTRKAAPSLSHLMFGPINEFEETLVTRSILGPFVFTFRGVWSLRISKCDRITATLAKLGSVANEDRPKFVFFHIMSPHQPYCFDENGGMTSPHPLYDASAWLEDKLAVPGYLDWVTENYPRNVAGLNIHVKEAIQRILDASEGNAIVIVQSDHGPAAGMHPHSVAAIDAVERFGILNAIFLPDEFSRHGLEQTISAVNTFRIVLRNAFGVDLPAVGDRAFYSRGDLEFEEVTHRLHD